MLWVAAAPRTARVTASVCACPVWCHVPTARRKDWLWVDSFAKRLSRFSMVPHPLAGRLGRMLERLEADFGPLYTPPVSAPVVQELAEPGTGGGTAEAASTAAATAAGHSPARQLAPVDMDKEYPEDAVDVLQIIATRDVEGVRTRLLLLRGEGPEYPPALVRACVRACVRVCATW